VSPKTEKIVKGIFSSPPLFSEWQTSEAGRKGITCQGCHMEPRENGVSYHGFDSLSRLNGGLYKDDLILKDIRYDFPRFSLMIENRVTGHAVPAAGPSRFLVLDISFLNEEGEEIHRIVEKFGKYVKMIPIAGLLPNNLIENTQLQSGETRVLWYKLPSDLEGQIGSVLFTLRFYDIADEHQGDLKMAHWISELVVNKAVSF
jgi:hypothetical protein